MSDSSSVGGGFFASMRYEIDGMIARDPAARSRFEVVLCYPSFHALVGYRVAHAFWGWNFRLLARFISQLMRWFTGIEIHPGATIGRRLFIDHGMGVVIGEASVIGDNVTLYQGVTLGGVSPSVDSSSQRSHKRHPTIDDCVIIGAGAQVLGPVRVGRCARVGSNAVVVKDVAEKTTVVGIPAKSIAVSRPDGADDFTPYGTPTSDWVDSTGKQMQALLEHIHRLELRIKSLENGGGSGECGSHHAGSVSGEESLDPRNKG